MKLSNSASTGNIRCHRAAEKYIQHFSTLDADRHLLARVRAAKMARSLFGKASRSFESLSIAGQRGAVTRRLAKQKVSLAPVKGAS
jgi:hypothetical protein